MTLIFEPICQSPESWIVRDKATGAMLGTIEWHDRLGAYGWIVRDKATGAMLGTIDWHDRPALKQIGQFIDEANAADGGRARG